MWASSDVANGSPPPSTSWCIKWSRPLATEPCAACRSNSKMSGTQQKQKQRHVCWDFSKKKEKSLYHPERPIGKESLVGRESPLEQANRSPSSSKCMKDKRLENNQLRPPQYSGSRWIGILPLHSAVWGMCVCVCVCVRACVRACVRMCVLWL